VCKHTWHVQWQKTHTYTKYVHVSTAIQHFT
jgi:hypothetical protein